MHHENRTGRGRFRLSCRYHKYCTEAARKKRLLHLNKKRSQSLVAGLPGSNSPGTMQSIDFENSIQHFWENVKRKKSGAKAFSTEASGDGKTGMAYAFEKAQKKAEMKEKLSVSSSKETETQAPTIAKRDFVDNLTALFSIPDGQKKKVAEAITTAAEMILAKLIRMKMRMASAISAEKP